eukprot:4424210-Pyramimonas_sp.AAC.2
MVWRRSNRVVWFVLASITGVLSAPLLLLAQEHPGRGSCCVVAVTARPSHHSLLPMWSIYTRG